MKKNPQLRDRVDWLGKVPADVTFDVTKGTYPSQSWRHFYQKSGQVIAVQDTTAGPLDGKKLEKDGFIYRGLSKTGRPRDLEEPASS
jgi:hypothetical protein